MKIVFLTSSFALKHVKMSVVPQIVVNYRSHIKPKNKTPTVVNYYGA
jgi:hypothetical protein